MHACDPHTTPAHSICAPVCLSAHLRRRRRVGHPAFTSCSTDIARARLAAAQTPTSGDSRTQQFGRWRPRYPMFACSDTPASFFPITHLCFPRRTMTHARSTVRQSRSATSRTPHSRTARAATRALPCVTFSLPPLQHHRSGQRPTGPRWWWPERAQTVSCQSRSETQHCWTPHYTCHCHL